MIDILKQRKIILVIIILGGILLCWKMFNAINYDEIEQEKILDSENSIEKNNENSEKTDEEKIVVHITGEVKRPGVVRVNEGSRIEDIIEAAGGLTENADITNVNLAYIVEDGIKIRIPSNEDDELSKNEYITEDSGENIIIEDESRETSGIIVNINTATQTEFEELPGIGPSIASRIVEYREQNGKFKTIEDIKNVTGIGDNKFENIKEYIKVK